MESCEVDLLNLLSFREIPSTSMIANSQFRAPAEGNYDFLQDMQHDDSDEEVCF